MFKDAATEVRHIVAANMVGDSPLARSLLKVAEGLEAHRAGIDGLAERMDRLEEERDASQPDPVTRGGVHELAPAGGPTDQTGFSDGDL